MDFWQLNPYHNYFIHPQSDLSDFFVKSSESAFLTATKISSPKYPYYQLPDEWAQEVKAKVSEILATPFPEIVQPKKA